LLAAIYQVFIFCRKSS